MSFEIISFTSRIGIGTISMGFDFDGTHGEKKNFIAAAKFPFR